MITLDALRAAALSAQPWDELDALVRAELAAGRLTSAIHDEIRGLQNTIRELPKYTDEANDAIGDTLDALSGLCSADREYKNPPVLPTEDEIAKLPRWARVAFAARCARRGEAVYHAKWPQEPKQHYCVVSDAITAAEQMATHGKRSTSLDRREMFTDTELPVLIRNVVLPAHRAAWSFFDATASTTDTAEAALWAAKVIGAVANSETGPSVIRRDFDHLAKLAEWQHWTDDTPVPPEVFGPLWPEGPPKGWPEVTGAPARDELALEHPPASA